MCNTDAHQHWTYENQTRKKWLIWNTWYTYWKKIVYFFFKSKYIFFFWHKSDVSRMAPVCCWIIRGQCRISSQGRVHNEALVASMQGNIRAWTRNLKKKSILIHLISLLEWAKVWHLYIYLFDYSYKPAKKIVQFYTELSLFWHLATLWIYTSLSSVIFGLI